MSDSIRNSLLICLVGPTGGGKTTHGERLVRDSNGTIQHSISMTSRPARPGEQQGVHYQFTSRAEFEAAISRDEFFEWEEVHGNYYGTPITNLKTSNDSGIDLLLSIDIRGALAVKKGFAERTVILFLVPPSPKVLRERIARRGTDTADTIARRLDTARSEYSQLLESLASPQVVDYLIVNDDLDQTYGRLLAIIEAERHRLFRLRKSYVEALCRLEE